MEENFIYLILAIIGTIVLSVSLISTIFGLDIIESENPYVFNVITSFVSGVGLGGLKWGLSGSLIVGLSFSALMILVVWIFVSLRNEKGISLEESIGKIGTITILDENLKSGKALIEIGSSLREVDFLSNEKLTKNNPVKVDSIQNGTIYVKTNK